MRRSLLTTSAKTTGRRLRIEALEVRALLAIAAWVQGADQSISGPYYLGTPGDVADVVTINGLPDGGTQAIVDGISYQSPTRITKLGIAAYGGDDWIDARQSNVPVIVWGGWGYDRIYGSPYDDILIGEWQGDWIEAGRGDDQLYGGDGVDVLGGGNGRNYVDPGCGWHDYVAYDDLDTVLPDNLGYANILIYPDPTDVPEPEPEPEPPAIPAGWSWCPANGALLVNAAQAENVGVQVLNSTTIHVTWNGTGLDFGPLTAVEWHDTDGAGNISFAGLGVPVTLYGHGGNDDLTGGNVHDIIFGGSGDDTLHGGPGNDTLVGEGGDDTVFGGSGADWFRLVDSVFGNDSAPDFNPAEGDTMGRDTAPVSFVQAIDSWNDQTGVATIQGTTVRLAEVTYAGVEGIFYDLFIDGIRRPNTRRANGLVSITVAGDCQIDVPLREKLLANSWLVISTLPPETVPVIDPLRG